MKLMPNTLFEHQRIAMAQIKSNYFAILHENDDLRKAITKLQADYDKLKNDYDGCKRNLEKTSRETSTSVS